MKNFKNIFKTLLILMCAIVTLLSCKKSDSGPEGQEKDNEVRAEDLLGYYLVGERKANAEKLVLFYFSQEGGVIKTNLHRKGLLRSNDVTLSNSTLKFDLNGDGKSTFSFVLEKDDMGNIGLKSYTYSDASNPNNGFEFAILAKRSDATAFENSSFKTGELLLKFSTANNISNMEWDIRNRQTGTRYLPPPLNTTLPVFGIAPEITVPYYSLVNVGWKSNSDEFIGISVPNWKNSNAPLMLIERASIVYPCTKQ